MLGHDSWTVDSAQHTVNKSINTSYEGDRSITNISVNGTIQGYIEGGIINSPEHMELPSQGSFLISNGGATSKYNNAKTLLDKLYSWR